MHFTRCGWPSSVPFNLKTNSWRELSVEGDCLLWEVCVVVPAKLRSRILRDLHSNHGENEGHGTELHVVAGYGR